MKRVYLDQMAWIALAKAAVGHKGGKPFEDILAVARYGAEHGLASFPLSAVHYMELSHAPAFRQREDVGGLMVELSHGDRIIGLGLELIESEIDAALRRRFGRPLEPRIARVFGKGLSHAFGVDEIRAEISTPDGIVPAELDPVLKAKYELLANELLEQVAVIGLPLDEMGPDYDPNSHREFARDFVHDEGGQAGRFSRYSVSPAKQRDALLAREWIHLQGHVHEAMVRAGLGGVSLLFDQGREYVTDFLADVPTVYCSFEMRRLQHQNLTRQWRETDQLDLAALPVAVVYCDVVVTEKHWAHIIRRAKLDEKYATVVIDDPVALAEYLARG